MTESHDTTAHRSAPPTPPFDSARFALDPDDESCGLHLEGDPVYVTRTRYLRVNEELALKVQVYVRFTHTGWLNDIRFQKILAFLKPHLFRKIMNFGPEKTPTLENYRCRDFQLAYGMVGLERTDERFCLLQYPPIKSENPELTSAQPTKLAEACRYKGLQLLPGQLLLFAEPYDPHNPLSVPDILGLSQKNSASLDQFLRFA